MESDHKGIIIPVYLAKPPHLAMVSQAQLAVAERLLLDQESYRVVSYSLTIIVAGRALKFDRTGDRLTEDMREVIANLASGKVLYFENVFAKSVSGEEVVIPWCIFRVQ